MELYKVGFRSNHDGKISWIENNLNEIRRFTKEQADKEKALQDKVTHDYNLKHSKCVVKPLVI